jgi:predicted AlkP superfamily pyrophosphatase or phosphodiesterase
MLRLRDVVPAALLAAGCAQAQSTPEPASATTLDATAPRLVVFITVDQFRGDYPTRFAPQLTGGIARLTQGGAWFTNAHQDHAITETAPGHASLMSGRFPRSTGIIANRIGVEDPSHPLIGTPNVPGASPERFRGTTLTDWLLARDGRTRVLSVSAKDRGAILPIGTSKQQVYWYPGDGRFTTSTYYADSLPTWVQRFNARHLPQRFAGHRWTLLRPDSAYAEPDTVPQEADGINVTFPHALPDDSAQAAAVLRGTPFMDEVIAAFALDGVRALSLGAGPRTDLLAVSFSATDYIGHGFGPDSRELHDQLLRLDRTIGAFIDSLYRLRDSSTILIAMTGDHGVAPIPALAPSANGHQPGHVSLYPLFNRFLQRLVARGLDSSAFDLDWQILMMDRARFRRARIDADSVLRAFRDSALAVSGVARVDRVAALARDTLTDPIARRWIHQLGTRSNVEAVITLEPYNIWGSIPATHGSPYDYDSNVPIVFYGPGVRPGRYAEFVRTVDIAPTLAALVGVKPPETLDGHVLRDAIR